MTSPNASSVGSPPGGAVRTVGRPLASNTWGDPFITCTHYSGGNYLECAGGTRCSASYDWNQYAPPAGSGLNPSGSGPMFPYYCTNGCTIYDYLWYGCSWQQNRDGWVVGQGDPSGGGGAPVEPTCPNSNPNCLLPTTRRRLGAHQRRSCVHQPVPPGMRARVDEVLRGVCAQCGIPREP